MLCIYCKEDKPKTDEHVIPYAFIRTRADFAVLKNEVCGDCNQKLGKEVDLYFAQDTLEGVIRYRHGIRTGDRPRPQNAVEIKLPNDPQAFGYWAGALGWINGQSGLFFPYDQVHMFERETKEEKILLSIDELDSLAGTSWVEKGKKLDIKVLVTGKADITSEEVMEAFQVKLQELIPGWSREGQTEFTAPEQLAQGNEVVLNMTGRVNTQSIRAYTKILFSFATKQLGQKETIKPEWDGVRHFILTGEGQLNHVLNHNAPFWAQETKELRFATPHPPFNLRIQNVGGNVVGEVQFFHLVTYKITLIENYALPRPFAGMYTHDGFTPALLLPIPILGRYIFSSGNPK